MDDSDEDATETKLEAEVLLEVVGVLVGLTLEFEVVVETLNPTRMTITGPVGVAVAVPRTVTVVVG